MRDKPIGDIWDHRQGDPPDDYEYVGKKKDGSVNKMWKSKPRTMLKKVALVQTLNKDFPEVFGGMYSQEEINLAGCWDCKQYNRCFQEYWDE